LWTIWEKHGRDLKDSRHIEPEIIDVIKYEKPVAGLGEKEALIITFGRELFGQKRVSQETFAHAVRLFGRRGTVDLVELLAQWSATCVELTAFEQQLPAGQKPLLPSR
jgi:4-carboxymuconolactone decarboxylase